MKSAESQKKLKLLLQSGQKATKRDFLSITSIKENPLSSIILDKYADDDLVDINKMLEDVKNYIDGKDIRGKLKFLFEIYDKDCDGVISNKELFNIIERLCDGGLEGNKIQNIVDQTFKQKDVLDFDAFYNLVTSKTRNIKMYFLC